LVLLQLRNLWFNN